MSAVAMAGISVLAKGLGFFATLVLAGSLQAEEFSQFCLLFALQTGIATFGSSGIYESIVGELRHCSGEDARERMYGVGNASFLMSSTIAGLVLVCGFLLFVNHPVSVTLVLVAAMLGGLQAYVLLQSQISRLEEREVLSLSLAFIPLFAGFGGGLFGFYLNPSVAWYYIGSLTGFAICWIVLAMVTNGIRHSGHRFVGVPAFLWRSVPFVVVAFLGWLSGYGNNFVIAQWFDSVEVANFTLIFTISSAMQIIASSLNQVWAPRFYRAVANRDVVGSDASTAFYQWQGVILGVASACLIVVLPWLSGVAGGRLAEYGHRDLELLFLLLGNIVLTQWWQCSNFYFVHDRGRDFLCVVIATSVLGLLVWYALMWFLGPTGIYIGFFAQMLIRSAGISIHANRLWSIRGVWGGILAGVIIMSCAHFIMRAVGSSS